MKDLFTTIGALLNAVNNKERQSWRKFFDRPGKIASNACAIREQASRPRRNSYAGKICNVFCRLANNSGIEGALRRQKNGSYFFCFVRGKKMTALPSKLLPHFASDRCVDD